MRIFETITSSTPKEHNNTNAGRSKARNELIIEATEHSPPIDEKTWVYDHACWRKSSETESIDRRPTNTIMIISSKDYLNNIDADTSKQPDRFDRTMLNAI